MTKRQVFYSFHYARDAWRASQVRRMGTVEGNKPVSDNDWEDVKSGGDAAINKWIDDQLKYRSCAIVLVGGDTANRKWVKEEIARAWNTGKGVVGIRIHKLLNQNADAGSFGANPFDKVEFDDGTKMSLKVRLHNPIGADSKAVYKTISDNLSDWVEDAIAQRK